jgi:hypothetical protein
MPSDLQHVLDATGIPFREEQIDHLHQAQMFLARGCQIAFQCGVYQGSEFGGKALPTTLITPSPPIAMIGR